MKCAFSPLCLEQLLRQALTSPERHKIKEAVGWDDSHVSRFLSGTQGIPIGKLDALISTLDCTVIARDYFDALRTFTKLACLCESKEKTKGS